MLILAILGPRVKHVAETFTRRERSLASHLLGLQNLTCAGVSTIHIPDDGTPDVRPPVEVVHLPSPASVTEHTLTVVLFAMITHLPREHLFTGRMLTLMDEAAGLAPLGLALAVVRAVVVALSVVVEALLLPRVESPGVAMIVTTTIVVVSIALTALTTPPCPASLPTWLHPPS